MKVIKCFYHLSQFCRDQVLLRVKFKGQGKFIAANIYSCKVSANKNRSNSEFFNFCAKVCKHCVFSYDFSAIITLEFTFWSNNSTTIDNFLSLFVFFSSREINFSGAIFHDTPVSWRSEPHRSGEIPRMIPQKVIALIDIKSQFRLLFQLRHYWYSNANWHVPRRSCKYWHIVYTQPKDIFLWYTKCFFFKVR